MTTLLDSYITVSSETRGGKACVAGTRITIRDIALMHLRLGQPLEHIAATYDLSLAALHAALAYYYDHRQDIDAQLDADDSVVKAMRDQNPSLLQARLKALNGD